MRYLKNFFDGHGLVYNKNEFFNALTSPLYTYLSIITSFLTGNIQTASICLSAILMGSSLTIFTLLFSRFERIYFVLVGALMMVCFPYFYATYGMETPLFIFLIGLCIYLFETKKYHFLGMACALLLLTRGEGIFLMLAMAIEHFRQKRAFPKKSYFIIPVLILAGQYLVNKLYYGAFLPNSLFAKIQQGASGLWPGFLEVNYLFANYFDSNYLLLLGLVTLATCGVLMLGLRSLNVIVLCFLIPYGIFYYLLKIPNYHWYYAPFFAFCFFYAGPGVALLVRRCRRINNTFIRSSGLLTIWLVVILMLTWNFVSARSFAARNGLYMPYYSIGLWLNQNTPADSTVAAVEIGAIGFYSERYIIDILGLVTPHNAAFVGEKRFGEWLKHYSPDYILAHDPLTPQEVGVSATLAQRRYVEDTRFNFPGYQLYTPGRKPGVKP